jgi:hypothetical protein
VRPDEQRRTLGPVRPLHLDRRVGQRYVQHVRQPYRRDHHLVIGDVARFRVARFRLARVRLAHRGVHVGHRYRRQDLPRRHGALAVVGGAPALLGVACDRCVLDAEAAVRLAGRHLLHRVGGVQHAELGGGLRHHRAEVRALLSRQPLGALQDRRDLGQAHVRGDGPGLIDRLDLDLSGALGGEVPAVVGEMCGRGVP